jgi:hypothetical protein
LAFAGVEEGGGGLLLLFGALFAGDHAGDLLQLVAKVLPVFLEV